MFNPFTCTFDEVVEEYKKGGWKINPMYQYTAAQSINALKDKVEAGDGNSILKCISECVTEELIAPEWLAYAFNSKFHAVRNFRAKSWDDPKAFGIPHKKGTNINARRRKLTNMYAVYNEVKKILRETPKTPIDEALFEIVGNKFAMEKTLASEYYYEAKSRLVL